MAIMTPKKAKNMVINNGVLFYGTFDLSNIDTLITTLATQEKLGLGKDAIKFKAEPKITEWDYAGKLDKKVVGMEQITSWEVSVEGTVIDFNDSVLSASQMEKDTTNTSTNYDLWKPKTKITDTDYKTLIVAGELEGSDKPILIIVENTYNEAGNTLETKDKENNGTDIKFIGHYDIDSDNVPYKLVIPV